MSQRFDAVIFDMDGVLVNSEPLYRQINDEYFASLGFKVDDELYSTFVGIGARSMWTCLIEKFSLPRSVDEYIAEKRIWKIQSFSNAHLFPIDGVVELLQQLKSKGVKIGLASSSGRDVIEIILNKIGIASYFDCVVSGENIQNGKPAPDIFLKAAEILQVSPQRCAAVEDSKNGVTAATRAEMFTIGYQNPDSGNQDLSVATVTVHSIREAFTHLL